MKLQSGKKRSLLAGIIGATAIAAALPAQADLFAYSQLHIRNFQIISTETGQQISNNDLTGLAYTSSTDYDGTLIQFGDSFDREEPSFTGDEDFPNACVGPDCGTAEIIVDGNNAYTFLTGAQGLDYVGADQNQVGSPIADVPQFPGSTFADVGQLAVGSLSATEDQGSANVNNGLEASWDFVLAQSQGITFTGLADVYIEAFASAGELADGKASAATTFSMTIVDKDSGQLVYSFALANPVENFLLNQSAAANANNELTDTQLCGAFTCGNFLVGAVINSQTGILAAGTTYQLTIRSNANIDIARVAEVPAPATLALFGLGLLGLSVQRRRRA